MDRGEFAVVKVAVRDREVAASAARHLAPGLSATITDDGVELISERLDAAMMRRMWKAAFATELALVRGAGVREADMRALVA